MHYTSAKTKRAYGVRTNLAAQATGMSSEIKSKMDTEQRSQSDSEMMIPEADPWQMFLHEFSSIEFFLFLSLSFFPSWANKNVNFQ